ncbi:Lipid III flippase [Ralstonia mannitolilytica]|nr:Lipid III flippase [Ralstonia mannitolilytica]
MVAANGYRQILRSTIIIGGASILSVVLGLVRTKVAAVLLGPSGVGLIGLFQNLIATASSIASLGFGNVGTRQIAEAAGREDALAVAAARRALCWGTLALALVGMFAFWGLRTVLAEWVLGDVTAAASVGWLALGIALTVAAGSQSALLNGLHRIGDIARVSVLSALLSTVLGVGVLLTWGEGGVLAFVLSAPLCTFFFGHLYVARLPPVLAPTTPRAVLFGQLTTLARLGVAFMLAGLVATLTQLLVRTLVQRQLGIEASGNFQASWQISMTYLGFVLSAMGTDYYPRLTAAIHDHIVANRLVNEQTEAALLLGGGVLLAMLGLAPWVIDRLYSADFFAAAEVLRWQILGDLLKVVSWPLGFVLLASGNGRAFLIAESVAFGTFAVLTWLTLPWFNVNATGIAFFGMYIVYLPFVYWLAKRRTNFQWTSSVWWHASTLFAVCVVIKLAAGWSQFWGAGLGVIGSLIWFAYAVGRLSRMGLLGKKINTLYSKFSGRVRSDKTKS